MYIYTRSLLLSELSPFFKIIREEGIKYIHVDIPWFLLELVYQILWKIIYKARILAKQRGASFISLIDLKISIAMQHKENIEINLSRTNLKKLSHIINRGFIPGEKNRQVCIIHPPRYTTIKYNKSK